MRILLLLFFISFFSLKCQINSCLLGKWQCCDSLVSAGYKSLIIFDTDSTFEYRVSEYAYDNPLESISGKYATIKDTIFFDIMYLHFYGQELRIGNIIDEDGQLFCFDNQNPYQIICKANCKLRAIFEMNENAATISILINGFDFYKISKSPDEY